MKSADYRWLTVMLGFGVWIWLWDRAWMAAPEDALPLLVALPLFLWLGAPWRPVRRPFRLSQRALIIAGGLLLVGLLTGWNCLLASAWAAAAWAWIRGRLHASDRARAGRLLPLALLAFPWLNLDFPAVSWWFRLSASWCAEQCYRALGFAVRGEGVQLWVAQMPFEVTPACAGIKTLQAMLIAGVALCFLQTLRPGRYWLAVACLPLVAWVANVLRVIAIVGVALSAGPEFAGGWFHAFSGWFIIVVLFGVTWLILEKLREAEVNPSAAGACDS